jgi:hypothetical protein
MTDLQIVATGTGKFSPLTEDQLATLNQDQKLAYNEVAASFAALGDSDTEVEREKAQLTADVAALAEAERNAPRYDPSAAHTALVKEMIASNRRDRGF